MLTQYGLQPFSLGEARPARLNWRYEQDGSVLPELQAEPAIHATLPLDDIWYLDSEKMQIGVLQLDYPAGQVARLLAMPALNPAEVPLVASTLAELAPQLPAPAAPELRVIDTPPVPILSLDTIDVLDVGRYRRYGYNERKFDYLLPSFQYGDVRVDVQARQEYVTTASGETVRVKRRPGEEKRWLQDLENHGIAHVPPNTLYASRPRSPNLYGLESPGIGRNSCRNICRRCAMPAGRSRRPPPSAIWCWKRRTGMLNSAKTPEAGST